MASEFYVIAERPGIENNSLVISCSNISVFASKSLLHLEFMQYEFNLSHPPPVYPFFRIDLRCHLYHMLYS